MTEENKNTDSSLLNRARRIVETDIKVIGDEVVNTQLVFLLAYIRDILNRNTSEEIKITVGKNLRIDTFAFSVNEQEIPQMKAKPTLEIG